MCDRIKSIYITKLKWSVGWKIEMAKYETNLGVLYYVYGCGPLGVDLGTQVEYIRMVEPRRA